MSADADPEEKVSEQATDLLRAALSTFTPQIRKMSQDERTAFNASVSEKMRSLARKNKGKNAYAALRDAVARDHSGRALGEKIMKERNANRRV